MTREEAIKEAYGIPVTKAQHEALQFLIPELRESQSEDERIRKQCIELLREAYSTKYEAFECISWLEKQKDICGERAKNITANMLEDGIEGIQHELIEFLSNAVNASWVDIIQSADAYAERIRNIIEKQKEQKLAEWSEEDEEMIQDIIDLLDPNIAESDFHEIENWLNSLSERFNLQPNQELNEEDKEMFYSVLQDIENHNVLPTSSHNWLKVHFKSFRLKPHWKPSKEQMDILDKVYHYLWADRNATADMQDGLGDLIDELKEL